MRRYLLGVAILVGLIGGVLGQLPYPDSSRKFLPSFPAPPGPLMFVRFAGPKETKITIYRGSGPGQTLELPCTVGFRPGYSYRLAVFDVPSFPRKVFFPSLEIHATLALVPKLRNADFPAQITFSDEDFSRASLGALIKKVVILERPDRAIPVATRPDAPIEIPVPGSLDPVREAEQRGQPMIILQMGQRFLSPQEMNAIAVPGTVLLPGDRVLGPPRQPPWLIWDWCPVYDPLYGPNNPSEWMALYNGGDSGSPVGRLRGGKLVGLDPSDAVVEYTDVHGKRHLCASNRIVMCIPRFVVYRSETLLNAQLVTQSLGGMSIGRTTTNVNGQVALKGESLQTHSEGVESRVRPSSALNTTGTTVVGILRGLEVKTNLTSVESVDVIARQAMKPPEEAGPLCIIKWPDRIGALVGDIITLYLKYTNNGGQPITNVVVTDSLTARFEYVKGTTKTDREAIFTTQPNEVGSDILRWEITGALQPHESGLISFQVRIR
jgi:uncharacterized repeat protein (TIGR01451 family)